MLGLRHILVLLAAIALVAVVLASTERSRPGSTQLGRTLGVTSSEARLAVIADAKILRGTMPAAVDIAFARRAATFAPLSALPFYILGTSGRVRAPRTAIAATLLRDPRFRPAYNWLAETDVRAGDVAGATRALVRLCTLSPRESRILQAIVQLTADPAARAVIKQELARGPLWRDEYLEQLGASGLDRGIVFEMLQTSGKRGSAVITQPGRPDDRRAFIAAMVARKDYDRAYLAWVQWLPPESQGGVGHVFDGGFKGLAALPPFTWELGNGAGGAVTIDSATGLSLDYSGTDGTEFAHQTLLLAPGRYRLVSEGRFDAVTDAGSSPLVWTLTCVADAKVVTELAVPLDGASRRSGGPAFVVADACPMQTLSLHATASDAAVRISGHIRAVAIEAVN